MRAGSGGRKSPFKHTTTELGRLALLATTAAAEEAAVEEEAERDRGQAAPAAPGAAEGRSDGRPEQKLDEAARQLSAEGGGQEAAEGGGAVRLLLRMIWMGGERRGKLLRQWGCVMRV